MNALKHGIDFVEAQRLWDDGRLAQVDERYVGEPRFVFVGVIEGRHWSAVVTFRETVVRIISVRRARVEEVRRYAQEDNGC